MLNRQPRATQQVLFLCTGNYYRSRFAEVYFNWQSERRGLFWVADSRGLAINPWNHGPISRHTLARLRARGITSTSCDRSPVAITADDFQAADHVVAVKESEHRPLVEANFPAWAERVEYWHIDDLDCALPNVALPHIEREVDRLIERLVQPRMVA